MIWVAFGIVALIVIGALMAPLIRDGSQTGDDAADVAVFKDQLAELERDLARGVIGPDEATGARIEIQRRMLAAAARSGPTGASVGAGSRAVMTAAIAVMVPFMALGTYLALGSPTLPDAPAALVARDEGHGNAEFNAMIEQLAARLAANPNDIKGWALLGRSYRQSEKFAEAREAFRKVLSLGPEGSESFSDFGEMATAAAGGEVTSEAWEAFLTALNRNREDPRARFYVGMSYAQRGEERTAIAIWRELTAGAPDDAPWTETVRQQMFQVAQASQIMPMNVEPVHPLDLADGAPVAAPPPADVASANVAPPSDPDDVTSPDVGALKGQFSAENLQGIQAMVGSLAGRLENNPDDYNGWMMLGRSYMVLKDNAGATRAFEQAMRVKPDELAPKLQYIALVWGDTQVDGLSPLPDNLISAAREALRLDPRNAEGLLVEGLAAAKAGDAATARTKWTTAQGTAPPGGALAAEIGRRLAALR